MARRPRPYRLRLPALLAVLAALWGFMGYRIVSIQTGDGYRSDYDFAALGEEQRVRTQVLAAERGAIVDRGGVTLAASINATTVYANPRHVHEAWESAVALAPVLGRDALDLYGKLSRDAAHVFLARKLERDAAEEVRAVVAGATLPGRSEPGIPGIYFVREPKRVYPTGLAAAAIGFVRFDDNAGLEGLEYQYDELLRGRPGELVVEKDPYGRVIPQAGNEVVVPAVPGSVLVLTLDSGIQYVAERVLAEAVERTGAVKGSVVVLDVPSGEILALANAPGFDPNDRSDADPSTFRNSAVSDVYEPGSTLKVVTIAAALDQGVVERWDPFEVPLEITVEVGEDLEPKVYKDVGNHPEWLTVAEIVAYSSNVGTILIQDRLGNEAHHRYLAAFGLGERASGDFPGESPGSLRPLAEWVATTAGPSTAIGYRVGVTPLQMAAVFGALANDGVWVEPHIVKAIVDGDGSRDAYEPVVRPVVEEGTAATMRDMLRGVVETGTGFRAAVPGYSVAGKTGTTEKYLIEEGAYSVTDRIASFIGMAPASDPRIVVAVVLDSPAGEDESGGDLRFGGVSAAPVFAEIAEAALHQLGVAPDAS